MPHAPLAGDVGGPVNDLLIVQADARHLPLADETVQCVVTSPPYWGLRKYSGAQEIDWHDERLDGSGFDDSNPADKCAFGLEPTIDLYVNHTLIILREIRRVLRPDGVVFWNIGDSYAGGGGFSAGALTNAESKSGKYGNSGALKRGGAKPQGYIKPKDLCLIPARVALAAQADVSVRNGKEERWWIRSLIIWAKPNPMPESCKDRPTDAYEHIIMLTKSERYFWDADAVREPHKVDSHNPTGKAARQLHNGAKGTAMNEEFRAGNNFNFRGWAEGGRNIRNVWTFPTQPYKGAHFATFPEELPRRCILAATKPGDLVLDPFAGSGTTGRVAVKLNRRAMLVDLAYHDHAARRTRNVQRKLEIPLDRVAQAE